MKGMTVVKKGTTEPLKVITDPVWSVKNDAYYVWCQSEEGVFYSLQTDELQPTDIKMGVGCMDCHLPYSQFGLDTYFPRQQWQEISGRDDGGGLLCPTCIARRAAALGRYSVIWASLV